MAIDDGTRPFICLRPHCRQLCSMSTTWSREYAKSFRNDRGHNNNNLNKFTSTTWLEDRGSFKLPRFTPQQGRRSSRIPGTEYPFVVVDNGNRMRLHPQYRSRDGIPNTWANLVFVGDPTPSGLSSLLVRCHCGYHVAPSCIARGQVWRLVENETYPSSPDVSIPELERCQRCSI